METQEFIPVDVFCNQYGVEISFISSLHQFGLIEIITVNETGCLPLSQLKETEKLIRLHEELEINLQGIDVVSQLLQRIQLMQHEIQALKNRLSLYEEVQ